ncbi:HNH endonuclease [Sinirhodobacter populi]|uniref:HNH endonuclease n=1 Tax=Paenirhodobacter populi TaxID=2306993 RepID=A0A443K1G1_9RHOB|nr:HNH endonuclease [Sinirhodobacter populi]
MRQGRVTPFDVVDHIKPKAEGGTDALGNLQCICADCHAWKTAQESSRTGSRPVGLDGWPVYSGLFPAVRFIDLFLFSSKSEFGLCP